MAAFLDALTGAILPVFAVPLIGYILGKRGTFDRQAAEGMNRFVFLLAVPAVTFHLIVTANMDGFHWDAILFYLACELVLNAGFALMARFVFGIGPRESLLLGMTTGFSNTVIFVLPIAIALHGADAALPIVAVITVDSIIVFAGTVMIMDVLDHREGGIGKVLAMLARNPLVVALALGAAVAATGVPVHKGIITFTRFLGNAAAPTALFAMGIIMSAVPLSRFGGVSVLAALVKVVVMPLMVLGVLRTAGIGGTWADTLVLAAAGPCGAMAFVIALRYGVATDRIAAAIITSTVLSTGILALLA